MILENKTILLTGSSKGIGKSLAEELIKHNATLILIARNQEGVDDLKQKYGESYYYYSCDLSKPNDVIKMTNKIKDELTKVDVLINCAGVGIYKSLEDISIDEWDKSLALNLTAPFILTKELLSLLTKSKGSLVVNIGSGAGVTGMDSRAAYCASKFGLRGFSLSMSEEFKDRPPFFTLITLGSTLTSFGPLTLEEKKKQFEEGKSYLKPEFVAEEIVKIIESDSRKAEYEIFPE